MARVKRLSSTTTHFTKGRTYEIKDERHGEIFVISDLGRLCSISSDNPGWKKVEEIPVPTAQTPLKSINFKWFGPSGSRLTHRNVYTAYLKDNNYLIKCDKGLELNIDAVDYNWQKLEENPSSEKPIYLKRVTSSKYDQTGAPRILKGKVYKVTSEQSGEWSIKDEQGNNYFVLKNAPDCWEIVDGPEPVDINPKEITHVLRIGPDTKSFKQGEKYPLKYPLRKEKGSDSYIAIFMTPCGKYCNSIKLKHSKVWQAATLEPIPEKITIHVMRTERGEFMIPSRINPSWCIRVSPPSDWHNAPGYHFTTTDGDSSGFSPQEMVDLVTDGQAIVDELRPIGRNLTNGEVEKYEMNESLLEEATEHYHKGLNYLSIVEQKLKSLNEETTMSQALTIETKTFINNVDVADYCLDNFIENIEEEQRQIDRLQKNLESTGASEKISKKIEVHKTNIAKLKELMEASDC